MTQARDLVPGMPQYPSDWDALDVQRFEHQLAYIAQRVDREHDGWYALAAVLAAGAFQLAMSLFSTALDLVRAEAGTRMNAGDPTIALGPITDEDRAVLTELRHQPRYRLACRLASIADELDDLGWTDPDVVARATRLRAYAQRLYTSARSKCSSTRSTHKSEDNALV